MKQPGVSTLGRALAEWCVFGDGSLEDFINRVALGLYGECASDFVCVAFIARKPDGSAFVGLPRELDSLPVETLLGLLVEDEGGRVACRVKDHSLDTVRFIDSRFRASIVARVRIPDECVVSGDAALWFGLSSSVKSEQVDRAHLLAHMVSEWFEVYGPVLNMVRSLRLQLASSEGRLLEMRTLAHDTRAPISALQYLMADVVNAHPDIGGEVFRLQKEISYVDNLLSHFSPRDNEVQGIRCVCLNVWAVISRVCERFASEAALKRCDLRIEGSKSNQYAVGISEFEIERVLSNIIGNAVRYAGGGSIKIECCQDAGGEILVRVSDHGPGFSQELLDNFELAAVSVGPMPGAQGWGLGLVSCKRALTAHGGDCRLFNGSHGAVVEMSLPTATMSVVQRHEVLNPIAFVRETDALASPEPLFEDDPEYSRDDLPCVLLVDDDVEHTSSLERLLTHRGVHVASFTCVESAFAALSYLNVIGIVCDVQMPDGGSRLLLQRIGAAGLDVRVAVMSGELGEDVLYELAALGASECFEKPIDSERLARWALAVGGVRLKSVPSRVHA